MAANLYSSLLLRCGLLLALGGVSRPLQAQYVLTGDIMPSRYTDLVPDQVLTARRAGPNIVSGLLDLNQDGRNDLEFTAYASSSSFPTDAEARLMPLHDDIRLYTDIQTPMIARFVPGDTIQHNIRQPNPLVPSRMWANRSTIYPYGFSWLTRLGSNPAGSNRFGNWLTTEDGYVAIRLMSLTVDRMGWVRVQVSAVTTEQLTITVKDFSLSNVVLGQQKATQAGWQIYPVPAADYLMLQAPAATTGHLTVYDALGKPHLASSFTGTRHQLDLSALAAGMYVIRIETAAGTFTQRVTKL
ncbi:T9SS type A sorting domain-containing protein [Hymenobacter sp. BT635]|uniref:T9SS type A sorting domain-containing protein n=1 Tax=Hymenobacter nitidus TaxID=2880929 RepID=A0ABS8AGS0_9BACT|nr:T9SS type A sorting domain-containing protein [Hymenobacter nitidus]MCB2379643.1 T9SS type A sorting domain-containing protein [Hymenobacter nitidus]